MVLAGVDAQGDVVDAIVDLWHRSPSNPNFWDFAFGAPAFGRGTDLLIYDLDNNGVVSGTGSIACSFFDEPHDFITDGQHECGVDPPLTPPDELYPINNWQAVMASTAPVPEPSTLLLLATAALALRVVRSRRIA